MSDNKYPDNYAHLHAEEEVVQKCRKQKEEMGVTWTEYLKLASDRF